MKALPDTLSLLDNFIRNNSENPLLREAREILNAGQLWRFSDTLDEENQASAYVLGTDPEPFLARWDGDCGRCECGEGNNGGGDACIHVLSLLLKLSRHHPEDERFALLHKSPRKQSDSNGQDSDLLFDWDAPLPPMDTTRRHGNPVRRQQIYPSSVPASQSITTDISLDPDTDLLFFSEPNPVEKQAVTVLGFTAEVREALKTRGPGTSSDSPEANFTDLRGGAWTIRPALAPIRDNGELGPPRPWSDEGLPNPEFPGSSEIRGTLAAFIGAGDSYLTPRGRKWRYRPADSLRIRFDPLLSAADDDPLYEPVVELLCREESTAITGAVIVSGDGLLVLDSENATAAHLEDLKGSLWFLRLMLSRRVLSASDLRARISGKRKVPENIKVDLPDLPDSLQVLNPVLVLKITARDGGTDLIPRWRYSRCIIDGRGRGDVIMDHGFTRPRPVGLRNREAEDAVLDAAEEILGPALAWRRGRYARLSGDPNVPLRLDAPLAEVLGEFASRLMDAGVELRLEDRPVRRGGNLNIRTRRNGSTLEMSTSISSPEPADGGIDDDALELELDSWLEQGGMARTKGAYFTLTDKALDQLNFLRDHGMEDSGFLSTSPDNLSLIDAVYAEIESDGEMADDLKRRREAYLQLTGTAESGAEEVPPPPDIFQASLRPYQQQGYAWLLRLRQEGLGGCLADDMGLGKTVQTLAYLSRLHVDSALGPSLLVGPVVTLGNWEAEIGRFAPYLRFHRYAGPAEKRILPDADSGIDLIVVSYQTLRNDIEKFLKRDWDHVILDEAHYVKNAASRTFKAIRSLKAAHRISLTGTPMENHLDDLWSQMSFLNPGLLGSRNRFNDRFVRPVDEGEAAGEKSAVSRLADTIAPFLLRRRKSEVLTELPPKDEAIIRCEMTQEQASAYESMRRLYRRQVSGLLSSEGLAGARIQIFTIISKLRLLAIHPPLAGETFAGIEGGKMAAMDRLLEEIMEEDHKTLLFSQFLGALDRAESTCRSRGWDFSRLTGSTKDRETPIRRFNEDADRRVFLLSLKAGGVGINLTAADYVMLLDPWWNPAVEAQAVDRAHRMGQTKPVMVYRFITSDTIEERVLDLQQRKKDLIAGVLGDNTAPGLSEGEILNLFE